MNKSVLLLALFFVPVSTIFAENSHIDPIIEKKSREITMACQSAFELLQKRVDSLEKKHEENWKDHDESTIKEMHVMSWVIETLTVIFTIILIKGEIEKWKARKEFKRRIKDVNSELANLARMKLDLKKQDKYAHAAVDKLFDNIFVILDCIGVFKDRTESARRVGILRSNLTKEREKLNLLALDPEIKMVGIKYLHYHGNLQDLVDLFEIKSSNSENQEVKDVAAKAIKEISERCGKPK